MNRMHTPDLLGGRVGGEGGSEVDGSGAVGDGVTVSGGSGATVNR